MKNLTFRRITNYDYTLIEGEKNTLPSKTVPNEALTIRELLAQYVRGVPLPIGKQPMFSNSNDFEDIDETQAPDFDLADASMQKAMLDQSIAEQKTKIAAKKAKEEADKIAEEAKQRANDEAKEKAE